MAELIVKTYDGREYSDVSWEPEALTTHIGNLMELSREQAPVVLIMDQTDESVVLVKYDDIAEMRIVGCGDTSVWL